MNEHNITLTSAELGALWASYMSESSTLPVLKYFNHTVEDLEVKSIIEKAVSLSQSHLNELTNIFQQESYPVPFGFSDEDVDLNAPRLYSDTFMLVLIRELGKAGLAANGMAASFSAREDIREFYKKNSYESLELEDKAKGVMLSKGTFVRAPYIDQPDKATFVDKQSFLRGWFGERRTLIADEIAHIYSNIINNSYGRALLIGFSQVAQDNELRDYFIRGKKLATKIINDLRLILEESTLPAPMTWDTEITNSTTSPFSDKLMLFQTITLNSISLGNFGGSLALSLRRDIAANYLKQIKNIGLFAEDGANLMIKNGWFERPPQAIDREYLSTEKNK